uniref:Reg-2-like protein n=1 Tax=Ornithodoros turicata TaxID=34597 RepID=A0A2R5L9C3_9ACAR
MVSRVRLVTFDATNTLLKFKTSVGQAYSDAALLHGLSTDPKIVSASFKREWKKMVKEYPNFGCNSGRTSKEWWSELVHRTFVGSGCTGVCDAKISSISNHLFESYKTSQCWSVEEGSEEVLQKLKRSGHKIGMISNTDERLDGILKHMKLRHYFDFVIASSVVGVEKPSKEIFALALAEASVGDDIHPCEALHVGDDVELDYCASKNAGWNAVLLVDGKSHKSTKAIEGFVDPADIVYKLSDIDKKVFTESQQNLISTH